MIRSTRTTAARPTRARSTRAALVLAGAAAVVSGLGVSGTAMANSSGATSPGPTATRVRIGDLLGAVDVESAYDVPGSVRTRVGRGEGGQALSACTGETRMRDVVGPRAHVLHAVFSGRSGTSGPRFSVTELVADQASVVRAQQKYAALQRLVRSCQDGPAGQWHYGAPHRTTTRTGTTTWRLTVDGDGTPSGGGIVVARAGRHLAVVQAFDAGTARQVARLSASTLGRLR